jgi:hypothetical protein
MTVTPGAKARMKRDQGTERPSAAPAMARMKIATGTATVRAVAVDPSFVVRSRKYAAT